LVDVGSQLQQGLNLGSEVASELGELVPSVHQHEYKCGKGRTCRLPLPHQLLSATLSQRCVLKLFIQPALCRLITWHGAAFLGR
jgi:hypothetical protein